MSTHTQPARAPAAGAPPRPAGGGARVEAALRTLLAGRLAGRPAVLLVGAGEAVRGGWGARAAVQFATAAVRLGRRAMLVDADTGAPSLHEHLGVENGEGLTEAVVLGVPLSSVARPVDGFEFVSAGTPHDPAEVLSYEGWAGLLDDAARSGVLLLLSVPAGTPGLDALARAVGVAIVLAGPDAPRETWGLPPECRVLAALAPAAPAASAVAGIPGSTETPAAPAEPPASSASSESPGSTETPVAPSPTIAGEAEDVVAGVDVVPSAVSMDAAASTGSDEADSAAGAEDRSASTETPHPSAASAEPVDSVDAVPSTVDAEPAAPAQSAEAVPSADRAASTETPSISSSAAPVAPADSVERVDADAESGESPREAAAPSAVASISVEVEEARGQASAEEILRAADAAERAAVAELEPAIIDEAPTPAGLVRKRTRRREPRAQGDPSSRYVVPRPPEWRERLIRAQAVATLLMWTYYIVWRWGWTLNPDALWFSIPLALAETWGLVSGFLFVHSVWRLRHRTPVPAPRGLTVDVFVTCYDEPLEVIRRTTVGALSIRYPHRTWVLDDGKRDEVRAMATEIGAGYLRRPGNAHAKAGNLNYGLEHTDGEYVLVLDADHVPLPHMLDQMLGFLAEDPKLAFVQSPQDFYNTDAFTYDVDESGRRMWEEQRLFFAVLQPGKDARNAAFFCGSAAVLRRAALGEIGGFSHHSITEDIETSLRLHARGWKSAFYGESLAYGLAAGSAAAFHTQHLRWGQGAMQVLRRFNPLFMRGLTLSQRLSYFASLTAYVGGVQKLVFMLSPILFFLTGVLPVRALNLGFVGRFLPVLVMTLWMSVLMSRGLGHLWISERFHVAKFWTYTRAVFSVFWPRPLRFHVTPKGRGYAPFRAYAPQAVLMAVSAAVVGWSLVALRNGWVDYGWEGTHAPAYLANLVWLTFNFVLASSVVQLSLRVRQQRFDHRFRDNFPIQVSVRGQDGSLHTTVGLTENLNPGGIAFRTGEPLRGGGEARLMLSLITGVVQVRARVVHCARIDGSDPPMYRTGAAFVDIPVTVRDAIELHCTQHAVPLEQSRYHTALHFLQRAGEAVRNDRREPRRAVQLPVEVVLPGGGAGTLPLALLEDLSESGARLVMDRPVEPGTPLRFRVPGTGMERAGTVVFSRVLETPIGVRYAVGVAQTSSAPSRPGYARRSVAGLRAATRSLGL